MTLAEHIGLLQSQKMTNETQLAAFSTKQTVQVAGIPTQALALFQSHCFDDNAEFTSIVAVL